VTQNLLTNPDISRLADVISAVDSTASLLMYGKPPNFATLIRWARQS